MSENLFDNYNKKRKGLIKPLLISKYFLNTKLEHFELSFHLKKKPWYGLIERLLYKHISQTYL